MKANTGLNKKETEPEKIDMASNQALQILDHRIDLVFKLAALFTNAKLIRMVRQELLSNPLLRFKEEDYCKVMF